MKAVDPLAKESQAAFVLSKLRGRWAVPEQCEMILLLGHMRCTPWALGSSFTKQARPKFVQPFSQESVPSRGEGRREAQ